MSRIEGIKDGFWKINVYTYIYIFFFVPFLVCCGGQRKLYAVFKIILFYLIHLTKENNKISFQEDRMKNNMLLINCKYSY